MIEKFANFPGKVLNRLDKILEQKGIGHPSDSILDQLGMTRRMFTYVRENRTEMTLLQAFRIAAWLNIGLTELVYAETDSPAVDENQMLRKHGS